VCSRPILERRWKQDATEQKVHLKKEKKMLKHAADTNSHDVIKRKSTPDGGLGSLSDCLEHLPRFTLLQQSLQSFW
jgi:hypothetical protein